MEQYTNLLIFVGLFILFGTVVFFKIRSKKNKKTTQKPTIEPKKPVQPKEPVKPIEPKEPKKDTPPTTVSDLVKRAGNRENIIITSNDFKNLWKDIDGDKLDIIRVSGPASLIKRLYLNGLKQKGYWFEITNVDNFKLEYKAEDTDKETIAEFNFKVKTKDQWSKN